jgi:hypothetical protein
VKTSVPFPVNDYPSLDSLCEAVLRNFSRKNLSSISDDRDDPLAACYRPPEAQFRDGWYRAFCSLVEPGVGISSEWTRAGDGSVDFHILKPKWGLNYFGMVIDLVSIVIGV